MIRIQSVIFIVALCTIMATLGGVYGAAKQREAFYTHNGSSQGCIPSDRWPCWKVDRNDCLWYANATEVVSFCTSNQGGWDPSTKKW